MYHKLGGLNSRNIVSGFWWQHTGRIGYFWGLWGRVCSCVSSNFSWFTDSLWCSLPCGTIPLISCFITLCCRYFCMYPDFSFWQGFQSWWIGACPTPIWLQSTSAVTLFPSKITFWDTLVQSSVSELLRYTFQLVTVRA